LSVLKELKDIKGFEIIHIDFLFYFIALSLIVIAISIILFIFMKKTKTLTKQQIAKQKLKKLDFKKLSSKTLAYQFTLQGYICLQKHYEDEFLNIVKQLEKYKYKKYVEKLDKELIAQMKEYIKVRL